MDFNLEAMLINGGALNQQIGIGQSLTVSYSFLDAVPVTPGSMYAPDGHPEEVYDFKPFSAAQETAVRMIFDELSSFCGLEFVEVEQGGVLQFGNYSGRSSAPPSIAGEGESWHRWDDYSIPGQDIWIKHTVEKATKVSPGQFGYYLLLHEIGHALGMKHPGVYGELPRLPASLDNTSNTVMASTGGAKSNYQSFDIQTLQYLYGEANSGTTISLDDWLIETYPDLGRYVLHVNGDQVSFLYADQGDNSVYIEIDSTQPPERWWGGNSYSIYGGDGLDTVFIPLSRSEAIDYFYSSDGGDWQSVNLSFDLDQNKTDESKKKLTELEFDYSTNDWPESTVEIRLEGIERVCLTDSSLALDTDGANSAGGIYRTYQAAFDRTPDTGGFGYWLAQADKGMSAVEIAEGFTWSEEFLQVYGVESPSHYLEDSDVESVVDGFYRNVLGRDPDIGGLNYYTSVIEQHEKTVGRVLAEIADSPENREKLLPEIERGMEYDIWLM